MNKEIFEKKLKEYKNELGLVNDKIFKLESEYDGFLVSEFTKKTGIDIGSEVEYKRWEEEEIQYGEVITMEVWHNEYIEIRMRTNEGIDEYLHEEESVSENRYIKLKS
jgi:hypothetical protein